MAGIGDGRVDTGIRYAVHDGTELELDLYLPDEVADERRPCVVLLHGGAMRSGTRADLAAWGHYFASVGFASAAVDYRLVSDVAPAFPHNVHDTIAAVKFLRMKAADLAIDPERIALFGVSAGAYLAAMAVLTRSDDAFRDAYPDDAQHGQSGAVDVGVLVAGMYDMIGEWEHDQVHRPDRALEAYLGGTPMSVRQTYYEASPVFYADTARAAGTKWLIAWGVEDDVVDPRRQSIPFARDLKRAGAVVRTCPVPGASHYWLWHAEDDVMEPGRDTALLAPRIRTFLRRWAGWARPDGLVSKMGEGGYSRSIIGTDPNGGQMG
jgi:acetyl esterase/lipase